MRGAAILSLALIVSVGCGWSEAVHAKGDPDDWLEKQRATPLEGNIGINDEYLIAAVFPKGHPVCRSDSGGHEHGFYQPLNGNRCADRDGARFMSVWASYNAAEYSLADASGLDCPATAASGAFRVSVSKTRGRAVVCRVDGEGGQVRYLVNFAAKAANPGEGFGPDDLAFIYTVTLGTDAAHRAEDLAAFKTFVEKLELAGGTMQVGN